MQYIFRGDEVVAEKTEGNIIRLVRSTELLASDAEYARTYYHYASNELGSITHVADDRGVLNRYEYDVWGNLAVCEETVPNRFLYTGQQCDSLTQQYYLRARYYNPVMARFTQEDTYRGDGLNLYAYCRNNPVCHVDPSGHCSKDPNSAFMPPVVVPEGKQLPAIYVPQQEALLTWYANFQDDTGTAHTGNGSSGEFMPPAVIPKQPLPSLDSLQPPLMPEPPRQLPAVIYPLPQNLLEGNPQNRVSGASADVPDSNNRTSGSNTTMPQTREGVHNDLLNRGFKCNGTSAGGYVTYMHPDGRRVDIRPNGEVINTAKEWLPDHSRKITNRYYYDGTPVPNGGHNTGEFVEPIGEGTFLPPKPNR